MQDVTTVNSEWTRCGDRYHKCWSGCYNCEQRVNPEANRYGKCWPRCYKWEQRVNPEVDRYGKCCPGCYNCEQWVNPATVNAGLVLQPWTVTVPQVERNTKETWERQLLHTGVGSREQTVRRRGSDACSELTRSYSSSQKTHQPALRTIQGEDDNQPPAGRTRALQWQSFHWFLRWTKQPDINGHKEGGWVGCWGVLLNYAYIFLVFFPPLNA